MLDGLLGRGFAAKCKSLIKTTKSRIELIRRKRSARERFLKKDIADLLANRLDSNAYGRIDGLITELTLSSCYDFVEECCDLVYKHLSEMQKQSECPAECKEAVASLMFSAARVADLPELRDLREAFQEKYGNSLQYSVNQKFIADLSAPAPSNEKKIQLMQDIAAEYSVSWNSRAFEKQMSKPPAHVQTPQYGTKPQKDKFKADGGNTMNQKDHILSKVNYELSSKRNGSRPKNGNGTEEEINMQSLRREVDKAKRKIDDEPKLKAKESHQLRNEVRNIDTTGPTSQLKKSYDGKEQDRFHKDLDLQDNRAAPKREMQQTSSHANHAIQTPIERLQVHQVNNKDSATNLPYARKPQDSDNHDARARTFNKMIPPPYVKPPKAVKAETVSNLQDTGYARKNDAVISKASSQLTSSSSTDGIQNGSHKSFSKEETSCSTKGMGNGLDGIGNNQNNLTSDQPLPKPKSVRRHSSRSSSGHDEATGNLEKEKNEKRSSSSRKKSDAKKGLQILFDERPHTRDEERVLDRLLIHLSTKPTNSDPEKSRRRSDVQAPSRMPADPSDTRRPHVESELKPGNATPRVSRSRSVSLAHDQTALQEPAKVFTRAASFQPDRPAKHVHPNLPDCDDLAARMAALRGSC